MLKINDLVTVKNRFTLAINELLINSSEYFVILGRTGSGKTSLLETIAGFNKIKKGKILLNGIEIQKLPPEKRKVGMVYQDYLLFPNLNVKNNILFSVNRNNKKVYFKELLHLLDLEHLLNRDVRSLSGGEKQRVALARALMAEPKILLLDEPLNAIDPAFRKEIMNFLYKLKNTLNIPVIHVTHNLQEALLLADKIAIIDNGKILEQGDANSIFERPRFLETARFLGFKNILPANLININRKHLFFTVSPHEIFINPSKAEYSFKGKVEKITTKNNTTKLTIRYKNFYFSISTIESPHCKVNDHINFGFNKQSIHFLERKNEQSI